MFVCRIMINQTALRRLAVLFVLFAASSVLCSLMLVNACSLISSSILCVLVVGTDSRILHLAFRSQLIFLLRGSTHVEPCVSPGH